MIYTAAFFSYAQSNDHINNTEPICLKVVKASPPNEDLPSALEKQNLKNCDSKSSYYGDRLPIDYKKARLCAFFQYEQKVEKIFSGANILMQIYTNGDGVVQNIDFAENLACQQKDSVAPAEFSGRLAHLENIKKGLSKERFDICDDITSGYMQGACVSRDKEFSAHKQDDHFEKNVLATFTKEQKNSFEKLRKASNDFIAARSQNEIDLSGSGRAAFKAEEEDIQKRDFLQSVQALEQGKANRYTAIQNKQAYQELDKVYQKIIENKENTLSGTVTKEQIKITQQEWLKYRDAWVEFAKIRYPGIPSYSIAAWFTKKRIHMLKAFRSSTGTQ